jgi:uncharacterized protein (TIGR02145 family)
MNKFFLLISTIASISLIGQAQTMNDIDGNEYNTVTIGNQIWMKENLKVTRYSNGDTIPDITDQLQWDTLTYGAYSDYFNNPSIVDTYGRMYNWYAISDSRNIAPTGWHVPSESEWLNLFNYLGGTNVACHKLRETGNAHWSGYCGGDYNNRATNESGFTALPGGFRIVGETFEYMGDFGGFWGSTEQSSDNAYYLYLTTCESYVNTGEVPKAMGLSIRCICDTLAPPPDQTGEYSMEAQVQIYPNPVTNNLIINCGQKLNLKMQIFDLQGNCLLEKELENSANNLDISFLSEGLYILKLSTSDFTTSTKLIKK